MLQIALDRLLVDDTPDFPAAKAQAIHGQLSMSNCAVPVYEIARALDINEIRETPLESIEGALITDAEHNTGVIAVNSQSPLERRRFSLAHELGHFLCNWHVQTDRSGFACTRSDMSFPSGDELHKKQESEANAFAIELLAPADCFRPYLRRLPDLDHPLTLKDTLKISKTAAVRRYAALHTRKIAAVFGRDGKFQYIERSGDFPYLGLARDEPLPCLPASSSSRTLSDMIEVDPRAWRLPHVRGELACQALYQDGGRAIVLLYLDDA